MIIHWQHQFLQCTCVLLIFCRNFNCHHRSQKSGICWVFCTLGNRKFWRAYLGQATLLCYMANLTSGQVWMIIMIMVMIMIIFMYCTYLKFMALYKHRNLWKHDWSLQSGLWTDPWQHEIYLFLHDIQNQGNKSSITSSVLIPTLPPPPTPNWS